MNHYAVIGHPITQSLSPTIHALFAKQVGHALEYTAIDIPPETAAVDIQNLRASHHGLNVTVPHKETAWNASNTRSARAEKAGAVNTLIRTEQGWHGENTDGIGLVRDLKERYQIDLLSKRILLIGAGGAAKGVLPELLNAQPTSIHIVNRTPQRAAQLTDIYPEAHHLTSSDFSATNIASCDLLINATSTGLTGDVPPIADHLFHPKSIAYDMMYSKTTEPTAFVKWAQSRMQYQHDGLGMLIEQAAESFYLWEGVRPDTNRVMKTIREQLHSLN